MTATLAGLAEVKVLGPGGQSARTRLVAIRSDQQHPVIGECAEQGSENDVVARPAVQHVDAAAADQHVITGAAVKRVVAGAPEQDVVALATVEDEVEAGE